MGYYSSKKSNLSKPHKVAVYKSLNPFTNKDENEIFNYEYDYFPITSAQHRKSILQLNKKFPNAEEYFKSADRLYSFILELSYDTYYNEIHHYIDKLEYIDTILEELRENSDNYDFLSSTKRKDLNFVDKFNFLVESQHNYSFPNLFSPFDPHNLDSNYKKFYMIAQDLKGVLVNIARINFIKFLKDEKIQEINSSTTIEINSTDEITATISDTQLEDTPSLIENKLNLISEKDLQEIKELLLENKISKKEILSFEDAISYTGLSPSKLYKMTSKNVISYSKPEGKIFFKRKDLDEYMMSKEIPSKNEIFKNIGDIFSKK